MISAVSRKELVDLVSQIMAADRPEKELDRLVERLKQVSAHPRAVDLIFFPETQMTAEEIADEILQYKPLQIR
jgi:hypothetical protein